jgi:hypothetical protein
MPQGFLSKGEALGVRQLAAAFAGLDSAFHLR